jgi:hypothetical protein
VEPLTDRQTSRRAVVTTLFATIAERSTLKCQDRELAHNSWHSGMLGILSTISVTDVQNSGRAWMMPVHLIVPRSAVGAACGGSEVGLQCTVVPLVLAHAQTAPTTSQRLGPSIHGLYHRLVWERR